MRQQIFFGNDQWCSGKPRIDPPVGLRCFECDEQIGKDDSGLTVVYVSMSDPELVHAARTGEVMTEAMMTAAMHRECFLKGLFGSVGHQTKRCACYGGDFEDPPGLTKRQAASAACSVGFAMSRALGQAQRDDQVDRKCGELAPVVERVSRFIAGEHRPTPAVHVSPHEDSCPCCGTPVETAVRRGGPHVPEPGDWSVCLMCASVLRYAATADGLRLRATTLAERSGPDVPEGLDRMVQFAVAKGPEVRAARKATS